MPERPRDQFKTQLKIEINDQTVWSTGIQEDHYLLFAQEGIWPPTPEHIEELDRKFGDNANAENITTETFNSYLARGAADYINAWTDNYDSQASGLFDSNTWPKNSPFVIIASEGSFDTQLIYEDRFGNEKVFRRSRLYSHLCLLL